MRYYIVEDDHTMQSRGAVAPTLFRYSVIREDGSLVFRASSFEEADKLRKRLEAFTEVKA